MLSKENILGLVFLLFACFSLGVKGATTEQCSVVFNNGASSFNEKGEIEFKSNATLINSSGTLNFVKLNDDSGGNSCNTQVCSVTGSASGNLTIESFQDSSSNVNYTVAASSTGSLTAGEYKDVKAESNSTLSLTSFNSTYLMNKLEIKSGATLNLAPGDYWIDNFVMESDSVLNVTAPGTVRIYTDDVQLKQRSEINTSGSAEQFMLISYDDVNVEEDAQVKAFIYAERNFTIKDNADLTGSVLAKKVKLEENSSITFDQTALDKLDAGSLCTATETGILLAYYQFEETSWAGNDSILDSSSNANHASPIGAATPLLPITAPISCQVLDIPLNSDGGVQDGIDTELDVDADIGNAGTISFWYRSDQLWASSDARQLLDASNDISSPNKYFYMSLQSGTLQFALEDSAANDLSLSASGLSYAINEWVHIAVSWNLSNDSVLLYLNGQLSAFTTAAGLNGQLADMDSLYIGDNRSTFFVSQSTGNSANGQFDDLRIYSFAQTQGQISTDATTLNDCEDFNIAYAFYQLEESIWPGSNTIIDASGFTNHGSPIGDAGPVYPVDEQKSCQVINVPENDSENNNDALDTGVDVNELGNTGSISFWYRSNENWDSGTARQLFDASTSSAANSDPNKHFFLVLRTNGSLRFGLEDENDRHVIATTNTNYTTSASVWVHVAVTWDLPAESMQIIIDGVSQAVTYDNSPDLVDDMGDFETLYIGDNRSDYFISDSTKKSANGQFDDIRLHRFSQTVAQVVTDASALSPCDRPTVAFYQFEEISWPAANTISDSSGNDFNASPYGDVTPQFPSSQQSCQVLDVPSNVSDIIFDAADTGIDVDTDIGNEGTISFWYRSKLSWSDATARQLFDATDYIIATDDSKFFYLSLQSGNLDFGLEDSSDKDASLQVSGLTYAANEWVHVAVTWDLAADQIAIILNGTLAGSSSNLNLNGAVGDFNTLYVGDSRSSYVALTMTANSAHGQFDDLHVYKYAQTEAGAQTDAAALTPCANRAYAVYAFEETSWPASGTVIDSSGDSHHGSPIGGVSPLLSSEQVSCRYVDVPNNSSVNTYDGIDTGVDMNELGKTGTISFWYKSNADWNSGTARQLFDASTTTSTDHNNNNPQEKFFYLALTSSGTLNFALENRNDQDFSVTTSSSYTFSSGEWVHIAATWDLSDKTLQIFINGVNQSLTGGITGGYDSNLADLNTLYLGDARSTFVVYGGTGNSADGQFDNLRLYAEVQSSTDINTDKDNVTLCSAIDHYRIDHDGQGFTCEAETVTIKACGDEACTDANLYNLSSTLTLSPAGWTGGDTISFIGSTAAELSHTTAETTLFALSSADPNEPLRCFNGVTETCAIDFVNAGLEFFGATTADQTLPVQIAESNFANVNIRAVRDDAGVCKASLAGPQTIDFGYDCDDPDTCLTALAGIPLNIDPTGVNAGTLDVVFDNDGIASLSMLNYADAGQLTLSASATLPDDSEITAGEKSIIVIPQYLGLSSDVSNVATYTAGLNFDVVLTAYGALDGNLPNYQPGDTQIELTRLTPSDVTANEGQLRYDGTSALTSSLAASAAFANVTEPTQNAGVLTYELNYSEVGSILLDVQDVDYFSNQINSGGTLELGRFIPAYFDITQNSPLLNDMCGDFSYLGQETDFAVEPILTVIAKNALGGTTLNYGNDFWFYTPAISDGLSLEDSSSYLSTGTITEIFTASSTQIAGHDDYLDGQGTVTVSDASFTYNKVDGSNSAYALVDPFSASIDLLFSTTFLTDEDGVCYQNAYPAGCNDYSISDIGTGNGSSDVRYGRIALDNTFGPETESLTVNIKTQYYSAGQWLLNTQDNCTNIELTEASGQLVVVNKSGSNIADSVEPVAANGSGGGVLTQGQSNDNNDLIFSAPNAAGVLILTLDPVSSGSNKWPDYLNIDWDLDGDIDNDDFPGATVTFGQFRGNDRVIHWREIFN